MPVFRTFKLHDPNTGLTVLMHAPFYDELLPGNSGNRGRLNNDFEAHALWQYYGLALKAFEDAKNGLVLEGDPDRKFTPVEARQLFQSVAFNHGVRPDKMVRYWDMIQRQRIALGGGDDLPAEFQFRFWGH